MSTKVLLTPLFVILFATVAFTQDILTKTDYSTLSVKVTEVTDTYIKYKKSDNPDGPTYTIQIADVAQVKYANGSVDKFGGGTAAPSKASEGEKSADSESGKFDINDENTIHKVESLAKSAGEAVLSKCTGKVDNSSTEVYYDGVYKDEATKELVIPIKISWQPKNISGDRKWIRGVVRVAPTGSKVWQYQNDSGGLFFGNCAKHLNQI